LYPAATNDFDGQPRPAAKDAGCDQRSDEPVLSHPLKPGDVGPLWMRSAAAIRQINVSSNAVSFVWDSLPALSYAVHFSSNLTDWAAVSQTLSNMQTSLSWTDDGSQTGSPPLDQARRFYRVAFFP
jgi:hypothetical protein